MTNPPFHFQTVRTSAPSTPSGAGSAWTRAESYSIPMWSVLWVLVLLLFLPSQHPSFAASQVGIAIHGAASGASARTWSEARPGGAAEISPGQGPGKAVKPFSPPWRGGRHSPHAPFSPAMTSPKARPTSDDRLVDPESQPLAAYQSPRSAQPPDDATGLAVNVAGKLVVVVALMFACAAAWKKMRGFPLHGVSQAAQPVQVLNTVVLAPQRFLHLVSVGNQRLLLASSPQQISLVATLPDRSDAPDGMSASRQADPDSEPPPDRFEDLLYRLRELEASSPSDDRGMATASLRWHAEADSRHYGEDDTTFAHARDTGGSARKAEALAFRASRVEAGDRHRREISQQPRAEASQSHDRPASAITTGPAGAGSLFRVSPGAGADRPDA
jgi:flagellar biogenesis protein FliO